MKCLLLIAIMAAVPTATLAAMDEPLIAMINAYRADPPMCGDQSFSPLPALAREVKLAEISIDQPAQLPQAMQAAGYRAARAEAISLSGPTNSQEAFRFMVKANCRLLLSPRYSVLGVSRQGREWQLVFAQPLLNEELGDWQSAGKQVLELVNRARATSRQCSGKNFNATQPLRWNRQLAQVAHKHTEDMVKNRYFAHEGPDGKTLADRLLIQQYRWRHSGENIAAGHGSTRQVVQGWLASPGHCANIMNGGFTESAAYVYDASSEAGIYWTQVLGAPR